MADLPPPKTAVLLKGYGHFKTQLSQVLPGELQKANRVRRFAVAQLTKGKP